MLYPVALIRPFFASHPFKEWSLLLNIFLYCIICDTQRTSSHHFILLKIHCRAIACIHFIISRPAVREPFLTRYSLKQIAENNSHVWHNYFPLQASQHWSTHIWVLFFIYFSHIGSKVLGECKLIWIVSIRLGSLLYLHSCLAAGHLLSLALLPLYQVQKTQPKTID